MKLVYSVKELADLAGVSMYQMRHLLSSNDVPVARSGRKHVVFASALTTALPDLADSLKMRGA